MKLQVEVSVYLNNWVIEWAWFVGLEEEFRHHEWVQVSHQFCYQAFSDSAGGGRPAPDSGESVLLVESFDELEDGLSASAVSAALRSRSFLYRDGIIANKVAPISAKI